MEALKKKSVKPHYHGHRERLRERFLSSNYETFPDYELLELLLFYTHPRRDVKPIAKALMNKFDNDFQAILNADAEILQKIDGVGPSTLTMFRIVRAMLVRISKKSITLKPVMDSWHKVVEYCRHAMAHHEKEQFRILFLNQKNKLISDKVHQEGTIDHSLVYTREVLKDALLLGASAMILVHNHPSGDPTPSQEDIVVTKKIVKAAKALNIDVHDHIIVTKSSHYSLKSLGVF